MRVKNIIGFLLIVTAGSFTYYFTNINKKTINETLIFVAKEPLEKGTVLSKDNIANISVNSKTLAPNYMSDLSQIEGKKIKSDISKYQIITNDNLYAEEDTIDKNMYLTLTVSNNISNLEVGNKISVYSNKLDDKRNTVVTEILKNKIIVDLPVAQANSNKKTIIVKASKEETENYLKNQAGSEIFAVKID